MYREIHKKQFVSAEVKLCMIKKSHLSNDNKHYGVALTYNLLRINYFWKNQYEDVKNYIKNCECQNTELIKQIDKDLIITGVYEKYDEKQFNVKQTKSSSTNNRPKRIIKQKSKCSC